MTLDPSLPRKPELRRTRRFPRSLSSIRFLHHLRVPVPAATSEIMKPTVANILVDRFVRFSLVVSRWRYRW